MVDESNIELNDTSTADTSTADTSTADDLAETEKFDVIYSCLRCNTNVSSSELHKLPEIKCICGFRVFTKIRPPIVKTVKSRSEEHTSELQSQ